MAKEVRVVYHCLGCDRELPSDHDSNYCDYSCKKKSESNISADDKDRDTPDAYWDDRLDRMRDEGY